MKATMPTTLVLVRHGETDWNVERRFQGSSDIPLNDNGRSQAQKLAQHLANEKFDAVYSSDLSRAAETAQTITQQTIVPDVRLREIGFGVFEGFTFAEIEQKYPEQWDLWRKREAPPPQGEDISFVADRVRRFFDEVMVKHADQRVLVVSHGGIIGLLTCQLLDHPPKKVWQFRFDNTSVTEFGFFPQGTVLLRLNDVCHLTQCQ